MDFSIQTPIVIYDDACSVCSLFAKAISFFGRHRISLIGHYSKEGVRIRSVLGPYATKMFWVLDQTFAFGGRSALLPLLHYMIYALVGKIPQSVYGNIQNVSCTTCKEPKAVFFRSASLIRQSQKIRL
ncbi:MAG: hypothetical protein K8823_1645 [Cenarchaeum symbiont of Oopsacas minuta]|nr:hypothetical protein [Cenarchaeum symbiont of Oopsacas minuta]